MTESADTARHVRVTPPLNAQEVDFLLGFTRFAAPAPDDGSLGGLVARVHRLWPGQPAGRSPWLPCRTGCCLVLERRGAEPAAWLRFLIRTFLRPGATTAAGSAAPPGLTFDHRLDGRVTVRGADLLDVRTLGVANNRVTERAAVRRAAGQPWQPPRPAPGPAPGPAPRPVRRTRGRDTVVDLAARRRTPAGGRHAQSTER